MVSGDTEIHTGKQTLQLELTRTSQTRLSSPIRKIFHFLLFLLRTEHFFELASFLFNVIEIFKLPNHITPSSQSRHLDGLDGVFEVPWLDTSQIDIQLAGSGRRPDLSGC